MDYDALTQEANRQMDMAIAQGPDLAISWLRAAFHAHEESIRYLREALGELRQKLLAVIQHPLSVEEAKLCNVCRICRVPHHQCKGTFILNYGKEFACQRCLHDHS